jgi:hypothetical protein
MFCAALRVSTLACWPAVDWLAAGDGVAPGLAGVGGATTPLKSDPMVSVMGPLLPVPELAVLSVAGVAERSWATV